LLNVLSSDFNSARVRGVVRASGVESNSSGGSQLLAKLRYRITSGGETPDALLDRITRHLTANAPMMVAVTNAA
jgi:hypothetical protein